MLNAETRQRLSPLFTDQEQLILEASAALKVAQDVAGERISLPDTGELQKRLMDLVHEMRSKRLCFRSSDCGRTT